MDLFKKKPAKTQLKLETTDDKIAAYMVGKIELEDLSTVEQEILKRWSSIWSLLNNFHSPSQAVQAHLKAQALAGNEISARTAWYDYRNATNIFSNIRKTSYEVKLTILEELGHKALRVAFKKKDIKGINGAIANLINLTEKTKFFEDDNNIALEANQYILQINVAGKDEPYTIDLDSYVMLPDEENEKILNAIEGAEITETALRKMMDQ